MANSWQTGEVVGGYSLLSRIAVGGMAEIWLARQAGPHGFEKTVVIKRIAESFSHDPEFVQLFLDEARLTAQLSHPNIAQVFDLKEYGGSFYLAMEYLAGQNLAAVARTAVRSGQPVPISLAAWIIARAAEGLGHAHLKTGNDGKSLRIIHRDVSPQNIVVTYDGQVKLVDFGIARATNRSSQTGNGMLRGKVAYMSPEQARGAPLDVRSDIFALGIVFYELVTRSRLFQREDDIIALRDITSEEEVPHVRSRNPDVPVALASIIERALRKNVDERYPSTRNFQIAIEDWLRKQDDAPGAAELSEYMNMLFEDRIGEQAQFVEQVKNGELSPAGVERVLKRESASSMPGGPQVAAAQRARRIRERNRRWMIGLGIAAGIIALGFLYSLTLDVPVEPTAQVGQPSEPAANPKAVNTLVVETQPQGALVFLDGKEVGRAPVEVIGLMAGDHTLSAKMAGYLPTDQKVNVRRSSQRTQVVLPLTRDTEPSPETPAPITSKPKPPPQRRPQPLTTDRPPPRKPQPAQTGVLTLDTVPWTNVFMNGKPLGTTPLVGVSLPAGKQQFHLVNESKSLDTVVEIVIPAGDAVTKKLHF
ncbi:MAG: serine/threonine protein kinase [Myxococcaceae bacterium]